jgi:hypothetical protein
MHKIQFRFPPKIRPFTASKVPTATTYPLPNIYTMRRYNAKQIPKNQRQKIKEPYG